MIGLALLSAPLGYAVLTGYLLLKIRPFPIALMPNDFLDNDRLPRAGTLAA